MENKLLEPETIKANKQILNDLIKIQELKEKVKELESETDNYKKHLAKLIHDASAIIIDNEGNKIASWVTIETNRLDGTALKEAYPDLYQSFVRTSFEKRLNLYLNRRG